ncbi:MAG: SDR family NAD(P)-dependent oxidoreductase [Alphaproteobacteria bacterium]|nr:SDR family NAD(P)-dependent oxidoreductase [Alphaproteobacteria bacterium]
MSEVFAYRHRVLFHDTMAYGSHHFLTNFKFQCLAREHLFFGHLVPSSEDGRRTHEEHVLLTREGYTLNLAPVAVGQRVLVLVTAEDITAASVRFCFRVVREDGAPVCAGYQTMVTVDARSQRPVAAPAGIRVFGERLAEPLREPGLAARLHSGRVEEIFPEALRALGASLARAEQAPDEGTFLPFPEARRAVDPARPVLLCPGQGSFNPEALVAYWRAGGPPADHIREADAITRRWLGGSLIELIEAPAGPERQARLAACRGLAQIAITLLSLLQGEAVLAEEAPAAVVGHSLGEIAALALAGVLDPLDAIEISCHRVRALEGSPAGGMLALLGPVERSGPLVDALRAEGVVTAVLNHGEQRVASGPFAALEALERACAAEGISTKRILSPHPFHSPLLAPAAVAFAEAIAHVPFRAPRWPLYSPLAEGWIEGSMSPAELAEHLVLPLDFSAAARELGEAGARRFVEFGGGRVLQGLLRRNLPGLEMRFEPAPTARVGLEPIAIVGLGCVTPGGHDPEALWEAVLAGESRVSTFQERDPAIEQDFYAEGEVRPDKTYSMLSGFVQGFSADPERLPWSPEELARLTDGQRYLAEALRQCRPESIEGVALYVGSTADGSGEHDEALLSRALVARSQALGLGIEAALVEAVGVDPERVEETGQHAAIRAVAARMLGDGVRAVAVDAACASSLYAVDMGTRDLREGRCDLALCGGVFAPGPANSCLFSQFRGLSATGTRPFDAEADGVVFSEGAAVLALRRLSDALALGETIHGVIHAVGTSSDGRSASVALPGRAGQELAMRRAWDAAGLDPRSADFVECHATSTPVGDAVEVSAVREVFGGEGGATPIGSLKAVTGHMGWAAGTASLIKMCMAFAHDLRPAHPFFRSPNPKAPLSDGALEVPTSAAPWGPGRLRVGVNGFGFGGSNAHVVLERFDPARHRARPSAPRSASALAVVGIGALRPQLARFEGAELRVPPGPLVLPDVVEDTDRSQLLALRAAHAALSGLGEALPGLKRDLGVVLGLQGKVQRSVEINQRLYVDRLRRRLSGQVPEQALERLLAEITELQPSGPYTLPGLMPNVAAGRVANHFGLMGPNLVLDRGDRSLWEALRLATQWLGEGSCRAALAGAICSGGEQELALCLALMRPEQAQALGIPVLATLELQEAMGTEPTDSPTLEGARGAQTLLSALHGPEPLDVCWPDGRVRVQPHFAVRSDPELPPIQRAGVRLRPLPEDAMPVAPALEALGRVYLLCEDRDLEATLVEQLPQAANLAEADTVLVAHRAQGSGPMEAVDLLDRLYTLAQEAEPRLRSGALRLGTLTLCAPGAALPPVSGLFAGFLKALARDWPEAQLRAVVDDDPQLEALARAWSPGPVERVFTQGRLRSVELELHPRLSRGGPPPLHAGSVVLATGGARGVMAVLAEAMARRFGCTVIILGRTDPEAVPEALRGQPPEAMDAYERAQLLSLRDQPGRTPAELRRELDRVRASFEVRQLLERLAKAPGKVEYAVADVLDLASLEAVVDDTMTRYGRVDMILHGAAVQSSQRLSDKPLSVFQRIVRTKLQGLERLLQACRPRLAARPLHVHLVGSAFSVLGNDGQPGYGAANEVFHRMADAGALPAPWTCSAMGWPGWASVGMTRGSEYAFVAKARGLRPMYAEEGADLFLELLSGPPELPCAVLLSEGELSWSGRTLHPAPAAWSRPLTLDQQPIIRDHLVRGVPTQPGTFSTDLAVRVALQAYPGLQLDALEDVAFLRFVPYERPGVPDLRARTRVLDEGPDHATLRVELLTDFLHSSGKALQVDQVCFSVLVRLRREPTPLRSRGLERGALLDRLPDPYHLAGSPVALSGPFSPLEHVEVGDRGTVGQVRLRPGPWTEHARALVLPTLLIDAALRMSPVARDDAGGLAVYVPERMGRFRVLPGLNDLALLEAPQPFTIRATPAVVEGEQCFGGRVEALDAEGRLIFVAEGLAARRMHTFPSSQLPEVHHVGDAPPRSSDLRRPHPLPH